MSAARSRAAPSASERSCRPPGSVTWMPSRVVNTGRTLPMARSACSGSTRATPWPATNVMREERPLTPQHRQEDVLVADFAEPEPVGVEAEERWPRQEQQDRQRPGRAKRSGDLIGVRSRMLTRTAAAISCAGCLQIGVDLLRQSCRRHHARERAPAENPASQPPIVAHVQSSPICPRPARLRPAATDARPAPGRRERREHRIQSLLVRRARCLHRASWRTRRRRPPASTVKVCFSSDADAMRSTAKVRTALYSGHVGQQVQSALGECQSIGVDEVVLDPRRSTPSDSAWSSRGSAASLRAAGPRCRVSLAPPAGARAGLGDEHAWAAGRGIAASAATASWRAARTRWSRSR